MGINKKDVLRYLGYGKADASDAVLEAIESCASELERKATPRCISLLFPIERKEDALHIGGMAIQSVSLHKHLESCDSAWLFAATLGAGADFLLERTSLVDMSRAVVLQACAASLVEEYCDVETEKLAAHSQGLHLRPRYSPGYGDFPLTWQGPLLRTLDAPKKIGLSVTAGDMLVPTKSVTAVIGLTRDATTCHINKCMSCGAENCPFRKETSL